MAQLSAENGKRNSESVSCGTACGVERKMENGTGFLWLSCQRKTTENGIGFLCLDWRNKTENGKRNRIPLAQLSAENGKRKTESGKRKTETVSSGTVCGVERKTENGKLKTESDSFSFFGFPFSFSFLGPVARPPESIYVVCLEKYYETLLAHGISCLYHF